MIRYKRINSFLHTFIEYELQQNYIVIIGASILLNRIANRNIYIYICLFVPTLLMIDNILGVCSNLCWPNWKCYGLQKNAIYLFWASILPSLIFINYGPVSPPHGPFCPCLCLSTRHFSEMWICARHLMRFTMNITCLVFAWKSKIFSFKATKILSLDKIKYSAIIVT